MGYGTQSKRGEIFLHIIHISLVSDLKISCNTRFRCGRQDPNTTSQWIQVCLPILLFYRFSMRF